MANANTTCTHGNHRAKTPDGILVPCGAPATHSAPAINSRLCGRHAAAVVRFGYAIEAA